MFVVPEIAVASLSTWRGFVFNLIICLFISSAQRFRYYLIPKLHNDPYKERFKAGSACCSTTSLFDKLIKMLTIAKGDLQKY